MLGRLLIEFVKFYQRTLSRLIRLLWGRVCRFEPSCSEYAIACLERHGAYRGGLLSLKRLCKCHPLHPGGFDPPPREWPVRSSVPNGSSTIPRTGLLALSPEEHPKRGAG